ncbi:BT1 folate/biopterin transporter family protein [Theileria equi strain WA]|uniref:BT1 folate/biopterin transporter family protein n=1 Tax=Theileria equi strain WA TaxID=1537102 RepID=L1LCG2_THEEQ|nr:BT1 folate/biopterin transporter family protein [Theileria equi strain WA]EKX72843.1 BT1 folate/biopterin transporter family protein [Theileria equi strain WA]|eukprot:XP_004832295.1 BT1 folate/biopterin transporter family protein [Theileria equi strain WA]
MLIFICGLIRLPLNIKMLFAFMSDSLPIFGSRRRSYLTIGSLTVLFAMLMLGIPNEQGIVATTSYLTLSYLGMTMCNVVGEALVIESGRHQSNDQVTRSMSAFCAFRKLTFAAILYLGAVLMMVVPTRKVFLIASVLPIIVFITTPFIQEREVVVFPSVQNQWSRLVTFASMPEIRKPAFFLFITMLAPSAWTAMFYFMTEKLHFEPELFGRLAAVQALAGLIGIYCYAKFFREVNVRKLFISAAILVSFFCLLSIVLVKRWNLAMGIPDSAFAITDNSMLEFVSEIYSIPIFVTSIRLCPQGIESSMYSLLWSIQFVGSNVSTYISALATHLFGVDKGNFDGLVPLIILCSVLHLIPIMFVWMIPEGVPGNTVGDQSELDSCLTHGKLNI